MPSSLPLPHREAIHNTPTKCTAAAKLALGKKGCAASSWKSCPHWCRGSAGARLVDAAAMCHRDFCTGCTVSGQRGRQRCCLDNWHFRRGESQEKSWTTSFRSLGWTWRKGLTVWRGWVARTLWCRKRESKLQYSRKSKVCSFGTGLRAGIHLPQGGGHRQQGQETAGVKQRPV